MEKQEKTESERSERERQDMRAERGSNGKEAEQAALEHVRQETLENTEQGTTAHHRTAGTAGIAATVIGGCLWGFSGACGQYLFDVEGVTARWLVPCRLLCAGFLMLAYFIFKEKKQAFRIWKKRHDGADVVIYGVLGLMLCQFTYFYTIELSNAGTATVIQYLAPVIIMVLMCMLEKRTPKAMELISLVLAVFGVFLIATHGNIRQMALSKEALVTGLISACTVVLYNVQPRRLLAYYPSPYLLAWGMAVGGLVLAAVFRPWEYQYTMSPSLIGAFLAIVILGTVVAFSLYMHGVKFIGPAKASLYACVEPIAATLLSALWLHEPFAPIDFLGFAMIIATILILGYSDLKKTEKAGEAEGSRG